MDVISEQTSSYMHVHLCSMKKIPYSASRALGKELGILDGIPRVLHPCMPNILFSTCIMRHASKSSRLAPIELA